MKSEEFFDKLEKETYGLMQFKERLVENHFPKSFEERELEFIKNNKILQLEEDLIQARDIIERSENVSDKHKNMIDYLENLLDEVYKI